MDQLKCVACIVEGKLAEAASAADRTATAVVHRVAPRPAVAILNGQTTCEEHIVIQTQSSLSAPNGAPLLLGRG